MVNEPSVLELLRFDCNKESMLNVACLWNWCTFKKTLSKLFSALFLKSGPIHQERSWTALLFCSLWKQTLFVYRGPLLSREFAIHYEKTPIQIYWKFQHQKNEDFQIKNSDIVHISAQNIDCGYSLEPPRRGGSNEYPQSMFWAEIRKIKYTPVNPSFTI